MDDFVLGFACYGLYKEFNCYKVVGLVTDSSNQSFEGIAVSDNKSCSLKIPLVYGFIDLFSGCGESWHWGLRMDENKRLSTLGSLLCMTIILKKLKMT